MKDILYFQRECSKHSRLSGKQSWSKREYLDPTLQHPFIHKTNGICNISSHLHVSRLTLQRLRILKRLFIHVIG